MLRGIIAFIFILMTSCSSTFISEKIMKSQKNYYKEKGFGTREGIEHLRFFNQIRRRAFEKLEIDTKRCKNCIAYLIEAYDVANGDLNAALLLNGEEFYYKSSLIDNEIEILENPQIDREMINAYINNEFEDLTHPFSLSSYSYIGTTIFFNNNLKMSHFNW